MTGVGLLEHTIGHTGTNITTISKTFSIGDSGTIRHLTASANISASGTISGSKGYFGSITLGSRLNANQIGSNGNVGNTEYGYLNGVTSAIQTQFNNIVGVTGSYAVTGSDVIFNHISASGDISASGTITTNNINSGESLTISGSTTISGSLRAKQIHIMNTSFNDDMGTDEIFIPMNLTAESPNITNVNVPMVMPVAGKLLKVHFRANQHQNVGSNQITFRLYDVDTGDNWNTENSKVLGAKVITGLVKQHHTIADFTTGLLSTSGSNAFQAGDIIGVTMQHSADQNASNSSNYLVSFVFELDFNGY